MAENQIAQVPQTGLAKLKASLNAPSVQEQFRNALKENSNLFIASIIDLYNGDKALQTCNPNAIISEALKAAVLDLPINKALGFAYIVVYNNKEKYRDENGIERERKVPTPTFIPGYKGYIQLAMRTGQYLTINADYVYEGELRKTSKLSGEIALDGERISDKIVGYFCHFKLLNGYTKTLYMSVEEMAKYAKRYAPGIKRETTVADLIKKANDGIVSKNVGWMGNFNDMALKTVIRRLISKYGYLSIKMQTAIGHDTEGENRALSARNDALQISTEQPQVISLNDTEFEEVDTETGEVRSVSSQQTETATQPQAPTPDY
ncbi:MAG: recombinase RecT [Lachnospiraceae bacterium]|nr:recombinase RecT [Bacteroides sp.]MCM1223089.1 recombinase RecT [Lachnospiraceae bacterium]MCM1440663.1 recombinase RecT [Roseburia sp.]